MEITLPTGDTQNVFSVLCRMLKFVLVYNLVSVGLDRRDTTFGPSLFRSWVIFRSRFSRSSLF